MTVVLLAAPVAQAQQKKKPAAPKTSDAPVKPQPAPAPQEPSLDFDDLLEPSAAAEAPVAVDPELEKALERRRAMLTAHQMLGFATTAALASTLVVGQLNFNDRYRGGGDTGQYRGLHLGLALGTTALFTSVGLLGLFAPTPYKKEFRWDTITFHRIFMALATAGMLTQVVLGYVTKSQEGSVVQVRNATIHQAVGYGTMGALSLGVLTLFF